MSTLPLRSSFSWIAGLACLAATSALAQNPTPLLTQTPQQLVSVLKSNGPLKEKIDACRQLSVVGTSEAVPALAALLEDPQLNHMARYALETIPDPAASAALRQALPTLKGRPLVGVIGSLGVRKDAAAVSALAKFLRDADAEVAQAAARALGSIGGATAVQALESELPKAAPGNQLAFCEGLFRAAEGLRSGGHAAEAAAVYQRLLARSGLPRQARVGAVRGTIVALGDKGEPVLREHLGSSDYVLFAAAVQTSYEVPALWATRALADALSSLSDDDHKRVVLQALSRRSDSAALTALSSAARNGSKPVRLTAVQGLGELANPEAAPVLAELLESSDHEISRAAMDGYAALRGPGIDASIVAMLKASQLERRLAGLDLIERRRMSAQMPVVLSAVGDTEPRVRAAAIRTAGEIGTADAVSSLLGALARLQSTQELDALEQALTSLCGKSSGPDACVGQVAAQLRQANPAQKGVLLRVLSSLGGATALSAVRESVTATNPETRGAAIRALGAWKTGDAAPDLLKLAKSSTDVTEKTLCLRSYLGLAANPDLPPSQRFSLCRDAVDLAKGTEEKKLLLGALGSLDSMEAVALIEPSLDDASTREEASAALVAVAGRVLQSDKARSSAPQLKQALQKVAQATTDQELAKRVKKLLEQAEKKTGT